MKLYEIDLLEVCLDFDFFFSVRDSDRLLKLCRNSMADRLRDFRCFSMVIEAAGTADNRGVTGVKLFFLHLLSSSIDSIA